MLNWRIHHFVLFLLFFLIISLPTFAGSPRNVTSHGDEVRWSGNTITYHPELGDCGPYSNADMLDFLDENLSLWTNPDSVDVAISAQTGSLPDITGDNYTTYFYTGTGSQNDTTALADGLNPMAFDNDGSIISSYLGSGNEYVVLGLAGINTFNDEDGSVEDGQAIINCKCLQNHPLEDDCVINGQDLSVTEAQLQHILIHEFGHFLGLDHSQVNSSYYADDDTANNAYLPIMYPVVYTSPSPIALSEDDIWSMSYLYPSQSYLNNICWVTGSVTDQDGNALRCADIQARSGDEGEYTLSFVSGALATAEDKNSDGDTVDNGECTQNCGTFYLYIESDRDYNLYTTPIDEDFTGASSLSPCHAEVNGGVKEEMIVKITAGECTAGAAFNVGAIVTTSTGGESEESSSGGSDSSSGSSGSGGSGFGSSSEDNNPIGYWCQLNASAKKQHVHLTAFLPFSLFLILIFFKRWQAPSASDWV